MIRQWMSEVQYLAQLPSDGPRLSSFISTGVIKQQEA
ncbi:hypothetical protein Spb1_39490 [Planctopirus ephydatiae]|uniref:Uncharacterized protein n=1 Tax=Planctopirus ephydatiae TaxID=2528019 RepID=A0A518GTT9_9PLAN|nr:hypothetical protein Spb1_39490 [Planctopirus ephydatiae]